MLRLLRHALDLTTPSNEICNVKYLAGRVCWIAKCELRIANWGDHATPAAFPKIRISQFAFRNPIICPLWFTRPVLKRKVFHVITKLELGGAQKVTLMTLERLPRDQYRLGLATGPEGLLVD